VESPIVTIPNDSFPHTDTTSAIKMPPFITWKTMHAAKFAFNAPFRLQLEEGEVFIADETVRLLPKRRLVAFGTWQNHPVVAKCFFDVKEAKKHFESEKAGLLLLKENKIPTPTLYHEGVTRDRHIYVLIFERMSQAKNLESILHDKEKLNHDEYLSLLKSVVIELATQHVLGLKQRICILKIFY
jgi:hypothetical protein